MEIALLFLPLLASIISGFFGKYLGDRNSEIITSVFVSISAIISLLIFYNVIVNDYENNVVVATWINSGSLDVNWSIKVDALSSVMLVVVTLVSALVHIYSIGYMSHDPHKPRFMAYLSLFTFSMLTLVTSDNFLQLFFGWEGVGLCSYFLIGFWFKKDSANAAAIKAFVVNRVGDFGFALGIFLIFYLFGTVNYNEVFNQIPEVVDKKLLFLGMNIDAVDLICILLFIGAMGKSAQIFLHTWLPDAMEGPTPVSALIHAATMVTAGVFLVVRCSPIFEYSPLTLNIITIVGIVSVIIFFELIIVIGGWKYKPDVVSAMSLPIDQDISNTHSIGYVLYTDYIHIFQLSGMILLVAMIGAIVLTYRRRSGVKRQGYFNQITRERSDSVEIIDVKINEGVKADD